MSDAAHPDSDGGLPDDLDLHHFSHRDHVATAFDMLSRYDFDETTLRYSRFLRRLTARAGRQEAFNQTVTIAFLALIAERMTTSGGGDFEAFASANPELLDSRVLEKWYGAERLRSTLARRVFVMPDRVP
jgi:hypothetical protein